MTSVEVRNKNATERTKLLQDLYREHFNLRMQRGIGQLTRPSELRRVRRDIARLLTINAEQQKAENHERIS
ncbi:MAG: 50S ribosomal protein L29 [Candidatus Porifericomitaceae bacterium WSBS_2022_MAG_OTU9]